MLTVANHRTAFFQAIGRFITPSNEVPKNGEHDQFAGLPENFVTFSYCHDQILMSRQAAPGHVSRRMQQIDPLANHAVMATCARQASGDQRQHR